MPVWFRFKVTLSNSMKLISLKHLCDPRTLCIVFPFEISNLPPHCVAHRKEEKQQQPYSGDSSVYGCSPQKRKKNNNHTLKIHHCMVVFLLFCGLHNEAGDSKFRNRRQYIAYVGHVGAFIAKNLRFRGTSVN